MDSANTADLIALAQGGDRDAYAELVRRNRDVAYRVAYVISGSAADAEDAVQEAFVRAFRALDRFRPGAEFRPWLLTIVGNQARNARRSAGRRLHYEARLGHQVSAAPTYVAPESEAEIAELRQLLLDAVNGLPAKERVVVGLRYFLDLSEREAAQAAGIPVGTVKSRLSRAMGRLRELLSEETKDG